MILCWENLLYDEIAMTFTKMLIVGLIIEFIFTLILIKYGTWGIPLGLFLGHLILLIIFTYLVIHC